jgi:hypothetical protein
MRALAFGLVLLGVCVFAWGLKYKLSLYDPPLAISHRMPAARLLTGKERAVAPLVDPQRAASPGTPLVLSTLALAFSLLMGAGLLPGSASWAVGLPGSRLTLPSARIAVYFIRPPPRTR